MSHDSATRLADHNVRDAEANLEEVIEHRRALDREDGADLQSIADAIADHLTGQGTEWTVVNRIELCLPRSCRDRLDALRANYGVPPLNEQLANQARVGQGGARALIVYLCGPISLGGTCSWEEEQAFLAVFATEAARLRDAGLEVLSPTEFAPCPSWEEYMSLGLRAVCHSDMVAVLPRWLESRGAVLEVYVARQLNVPVEPVEALPKPHPPRNRGEGTGVDGLMPVGQEDAPSE